MFFGCVGSSSWHDKLHYWKPRCRSAAAGVVINTAYACTAACIGVGNGCITLPSHPSLGNLHAFRWRTLTNSSVWDGIYALANQQKIITPWLDTTDAAIKIDVRYSEHSELSEMPGVGENDVLCALTAARNSAFIISAFPVHSASFFSDPLQTYMALFKHMICATCAMNQTLIASW